METREYRIPSALRQRLISGARHAAPPSALRQRLISGARHAARRRQHRLIRVGAGLEKGVVE